MQSSVLTLQTSNYSMATHIWGDHSKPHLLLLHGFLGTGDDWSAIAENLPEQWCVIAPDIPGHGETCLADSRSELSDVQLFSLESVAAGIIEILDIRECEKAYLCGYSMGGRLALYLALRFPERFQAALILSATAGLRSEEERLLRRKSDEELAQRLDAVVTMSNFLDFWYNQALFAPFRRHAAFKHIVEKRRNGNPRGAALSLRGMGTGSQPSLWGELAQNRVPITFVAGALDTKFTLLAEELHQKTPHSECRIIPDVGHVLPYECADEITEWCTRFYHKFNNNV